MGSYAGKIYTETHMIVKIIFFILMPLLLSCHIKCLYLYYEITISIIIYFQHGIVKEH